jgi:hypothetical protein
MSCDISLRLWQPTFPGFVAATMPAGASRLDAPRAFANKHSARVSNEGFARDAPVRLKPITALLPGQSIPANNHAEHDSPPPLLPRLRGEGIRVF